jgi:hypothetical protein
MWPVRPEWCTEALDWKRLIPAPKMTAGSRIAAANIQANGGDGRGEVAAGRFFCVFLGYAGCRFSG